MTTESKMYWAFFLTFFAGFLSGAVYSLLMAAVGWSL